MTTVSKKDIVNQIANQTQVKQVVVKNIVQNFLNEIVNELGNNNKLEFRGFGIFEIKNRSPRIAQNPKTLEKVQVGAKRTVKFRAGKLMKQKLTEGK